MDNQSQIGRFAPSPTGRMHLGNVYAALLSWLSVKSKGGQWLLRIEDLDAGRSRREFAEQLMDDLHWLGLNWDLGPYWQSSRSNIYAAYLQRLKEGGHTFPCYLSRGEVLATQAPHETDGRIVYGPALRAKNEEMMNRGLMTRQPSIRMRVPNEEITFTDEHYGLIKTNLEKQCGDFILQRSDGAWAYQLAVVVDDALMGVTEVVRGRDLLLSVPQQLYLYRILDFQPPRYAHIPLLLGEQGQRLCKRDKSLDMGELRNHFTPEQILGKLAFYAGLTKSEKALGANEILPLFTWNKIPVDDIYVS